MHTARALRTAALTFTALVLLAALPLTAQAHRANIFAYTEGDTIRIEASFSGGKPVLRAPVEVYDAASGALLLTTQTDDQGLGAFPVPQAARDARADLRLVLLAGEGHRGEWVVKAGEYLADAQGPGPAADTAPTAAATAPATAAGAAPALVDEAALRRIVAETVSHELAPLRRSLAAMAEPGPTVHDVLSGIGYILGLFGIAAWMHGRKARR
ncbi:hypothetical protein [Desulfocurvus sp.]|jgi:nickel transport protein|uniref:hypothetical protein n=1 Tax=Desulfocurvus sp. TaxID=2871698 RepID=UPI0025C58687|nr:hypothetical protein [Desulfocurvus sp.]MCK9240891.1 hypothetical protein [Desulfocurvus sp.]